MENNSYKVLVNIVRIFNKYTDTEKAVLENLMKDDNRTQKAADKIWSLVWGTYNLTEPRKEKE